MGEFQQIISLAGAFVLMSGCTGPQPTRFDSVVVRGTASFQQQVTNALVVLKTKAPAAYATVTNEIGIIEQGKRSGMRAWLKPPKFELADGSAFYSLTWCAATIGHDSLHSKLYHDYLKQHPGASRVPDSVWKGEGPEHLCSQHEVQVLKDIRAPLYEINWCSQTNNRYWEVDYGKRNW